MKLNLAPAWWRAVKGPNSATSRCGTQSPGPDPRQFVPMKKTLLVSLAVLSVCTPCMRAAELVLVARDATPLPIIVYAGAPPRTRDAAVTLADYLEKISGQRPEVIDGAPATKPEHAIWIGVQPAAKRSR